MRTAAAVTIAVALLASSTPAPAGVRAYVPNLDSGDLYVLDTASLSLVATVPIGNDLFGAAVSPDARRVYVTFASGLTVLEAHSNQIIARVSLGALPGSSGVAITPDGNRIYVTNQLANTVSLVDAATTAVIRTIPVAAAPAGVDVAPDGVSTYVVSIFGNGTDSGTVSIISSISNSVTKVIPVGVAPTGVAVSPDGARAYVTNFFGDDPTRGSNGTVSVLDTGSEEIVGTITVGSGPSVVAVSPDSHTIYVANECGATLPCDSRREIGSVSVIEAGTVTAEIPVGRGAEGLAVTPDGGRVLVTNFCDDNAVNCDSNAGSVSVIDAASKSIVGTIPVGRGPLSWGKFIAPKALPLKCPLGQGFWKVHGSAWRVTSLTLGSQTYTQAELLTLLKTPVGAGRMADASLILADQLIAAKLNIANGSDPTPVGSTITDADALLATFKGKVPYQVTASSTGGQAIVNDASVLDSYNNGTLTPNCVP